MRTLHRVFCAFAVLYALPIVAPSAFRLPTVTTAAAQEAAKVWVNTHSGVYHCPGSRYYGTTKAGQFMAEAEARAAGNRPAYGQPCGSSEEVSAAVDQQPLRLAAPAEPAAVGAKVWVNTSSGVYHCPGSRYYGTTKSGRFMSEAEARAAGNRPAYGKVCG
jgi:hypothetical protein